LDAVVRGKLSPAMAMEKIIGRSQCSSPFESFIEFLLNFADTRMPPLEALSNEGARNAASCLKAHIITPAGRPEAVSCEPPHPLYG